jgi:hypothetical protein
MMSKTNSVRGRRNSRQWDVILFFASGSFMLINLAALWIRTYFDSGLSIMWAAIPGIIGFAASVIGLLTLYSRISSQAPRLARSGAGFALVSGAALGIAAVWIFSTSIFGSGISGSAPSGVLALIGVFIMSMVIAFICNAVAFLIGSSLRNIGFLLLVPVASWGVMLVVGMNKGLEAGLSLDVYTNGIIALAFLLLGFFLQKNKEVTG